MTSTSELHTKPTVSTFGSCPTADTVSALLVTLGGNRALHQNRYLAGASAWSCSLARGMWRWYRRNGHSCTARQPSPGEAICVGISRLWMARTTASADDAKRGAGPDDGGQHLLQMLHGEMFVGGRQRGCSLLLVCSDVSAGGSACGGPAPCEL